MFEFEEEVTTAPPRDEEETIEVPETLPLMAVRDVVLFPAMVIPLFVGRQASLAALEEALEKDRLIVLATQKNPDLEEPTPEDLFSVGVVAVIMRTLKLPDGRLKVLVQALARASITEYLQTKPFFQVRIEPIREEEPTRIDIETEALIRSVKETAEKVFALRGQLNPDLTSLLDTLEEPGRLADIVATHLRLKIPEAQELLETFDPVERLRKLHHVLLRELEVATVKAKIQTEAQEEMNRTQREYFLREQLRAIKRELGEVDEHAQEIEELR